MKDKVYVQVMKKWNDSHTDKLDLETIEQMIYNNSSAEIMDIYYNTKQEIDDQDKIDSIKNDIAKIKKILKKAKVKNKNINTCPLCFVSDQNLDSGIFFLNWNSTQINDYIQINKLPIVIDEITLKQHKEHIYIDSDTIYNKPVEIEKQLKKLAKIGSIEGVTDLQILDGRIKMMTSTIAKMDASGSTWRKEYKEISELLQRYIELKNKITVGDKISIEGKLEVADIIKKIISD